MLTAMAMAMVVQPAGAGRPPACSAARLSACSDTNRLIWASDFRPALSRFLGRSAAQRIDYVYKGRLIDQLEDVLGGPPDDPRPLPGGGLLFTACRPHSCTEKGAVAFDAAGRMTAVAIVSYRCGDGGSTCRGPGLDVYCRDPRASAAARTAIAAWATAAVADDDRVLHTGPMTGPVLHRLR